MSQDASMLAYSTGSGFETVSMATGTGKHSRVVGPMGHYIDNLNFGAPFAW